MRHNPFPALRPAATQTLPGNDHFEPSHHLWGREEIDALTLAFAARRPLLVRGEAGVGKSQIARAAAAVMYAGPPLVEVIHPRFEALELLYRFDAVARLSDAQVKDANGQSLLDATNARYVGPGGLWRAFALGRQSKKPQVLLIDEIDKADADLPNALLDVLGNRSFSVPHLKNAQQVVHRVQAQPEHMPLIVITTNEERELPAAFVRRCVVLNLAPPEDEAGFAQWLCQRARVHPNLAELDDTVLRTAAAQVWKDRCEADGAGFPKVGLAEYIDLLVALHELTAASPRGERTAQQLHWLQRLSAYALVKNAKQDQARAPVEPLAATP
ncbi:AAA family ATPase [Vitreoscilla filiformis]|uniref:AAA family ATPase n=1 Tax=Vitreoscilla filiformis TaxID=63 RepID=UPI000B7AE060|nr:MoxR family ATPase [Vitreoscilla filiformis]